MFYFPENFTSGQFVRLNAQTISSHTSDAINLIARIATNNTFYSEKEMDRGSSFTLLTF